MIGLQEAAKLFISHLLRLQGRPYRAEGSSTTSGQGRNSPAEKTANANLRCLLARVITLPCHRLDGAQ